MTDQYLHLKETHQLCNYNFSWSSDPYGALLDLSSETLTYVMSILRQEEPIPIDHFKEDEWHDVICLMIHHGIMPLCYWRVNQLPIALHPPAVIDSHMRNVFLANLARYLRVEQQLEEILRAFDERGIETLIIRGIGLANTVYPDYATRPFNDFDLLVGPDYYSQAREVLYHLGYRGQFRRFGMFKDLFNAESFLHKSQTRKYCQVDLHWSLFQYHGLRRDNGTVGLFHRAEIVQTKIFNFKTLSKIDALVDAAFHTILHHPGNKRLMWISDIAFLSQALIYPDEWEILSKRCLELRLSLAMEEALKLAIQWYNLQIPEVYRDFTKWLNPNENEKAEYFYVKRKQGPDIRLRGYLDSFLSAPGKMRFIKEFLFPPSEYIRMTYPPSRKWLLPISYIRRWFNWIAKVFKYVVHDFCIKKIS